VSGAELDGAVAVGLYRQRLGPPTCPAIAAATRRPSSRRSAGLPAPPKTAILDPTMKFFNTAGPVNRPNHYKIDPLHRWDLEEVLTLIHSEKYFILHAPRQTGKTSSLLALQEYLNNEGRYLAIYVNIEAAQTARHDVAECMRVIASEMGIRVEALLDRPDIRAEISAVAVRETENALRAILSYLSQTLTKPVVLFVDEIDALVGDSLVSVLRQLRSGYDSRPTKAPSTVVGSGEWASPCLAAA
jgi:Cdc6-like AAA superfamily ATPase